MHEIPVKVSICIPTYNGMDNLPELLVALRGQELVSLEILVIDSNSSDGTWEFIQAQPNVVSKQIPQSEFSHGATRQRLAEMATNEIVIFLTQDATPNGPLFTFTHANLHYSLGERVGAVLGAQHPRRHSAAAIAQRVQRTFKDLGPSTGVVVYRNDDLMKRFYGTQPLSFLSDVNASYKRSLLVGAVPFRNVPYAEDQFMARDLLAAGYDIVYSPQADVLHANEIPPRDYAKRIEDELVGVHSSLGIALARQSLGGSILNFLGNLRHDFKYIYRNRKRSGIKWSVREMIFSPVYEVQAIRGRSKARRILKDVAF
ncbi:MAG: glycosyltransferase [Actinobacteria bacterium]|nr:glycosyltransferase [Actinomycetota bacterium]